MTWSKKIKANFKFRIPHQLLITVGLLSLAAIILNGLFLASDIVPKYFGWFNFPFTIMMFVGIVWGIEKWIND